MRIGYFQFRPVFGQVQRNTKRVCEALADVQADLIVLPELPFTGYHFAHKEELRAVAEVPEESDTAHALIELCRERNFHIVTGWAEKSRDKIFNSALLIGPEGIKHRYRKLHLFNEEKHWFDPGDLPLETVKIKGVRIGTIICFDWVFPEAMRVLAIKGAHIICHPSNLVLAGFCQQAMLTRATENGVFIITANRFGSDKRPHGEIRFTGKSQIVAPKGELLYSSPAQREDLVILELDPALAEDKKLTPLNDVIRDRRPEFYTFD